MFKDQEKLLDSILVAFWVFNANDSNFFYVFKAVFVNISDFYQDFCIFLLCRISLTTKVKIIVIKEQNSFPLAYFLAIIYLQTIKKFHFVGKKCVSTKNLQKIGSHSPSSQQMCQVMLKSILQTSMPSHNEPKIISTFCNSTG